jgi:hypothetical protein
MKPQFKSTPQILHPAIKSRVPYGFSWILENNETHNTGPKDKQLMDWLWYNQYPGSNLVALYNSIQKKMVNLQYGLTK